MHELTNLFHTLRTKLGIKDSERNLVLKYRIFLRKHIQEEMEFLDITSLGTTYRYAAKIEHKFKQKKRDFGSTNLKLGKGAPEPQSKGKSQRNMTQNTTTNPNKTRGSGGNFTIVPLIAETRVGPNSH